MLNLTSFFIHLSIKGITLVDNVLYSAMPMSRLMGFKDSGRC